MLKKLFSKKKKQNKSPLAACGEKAIGSWDLPLVVLVITLVAFGLVMLFSASYAYAYYRFGDSYRYISNQLFFAVLGIIVMVAASMVDYHIFHRLVPALMALTYLLLFIVLFFVFPDLCAAGAFPPRRSRRCNRPAKTTRRASAR